MALELPKVSILIPTYNRRHFLPLIMVNLYSQTYPKHLLEVVIVDDGKDPLFLNNDEVKLVSSKVGIHINYVRDTKKHYGIGEKRNLCVKNAKYKICINMDDDDCYFPTYIEYSVGMLKQNKSGLVGSAEMLFLFPHHKWKITGIRCEAKRQIHEATMCFTKRHWGSMGGFVKKGFGEGSKLVDWNDKQCVMTDISKCMICIAHKNNSVDKEMFKDKNFIEGGLELSFEILQIISECIGIPLDYDAKCNIKMNIEDADDATKTILYE
jgi:glycosyltransferase involved in cell wall biosynthesis